MKVKLLKRVFFVAAPLMVIGLVGWSLRYESEFFIIKNVPIEIEYDRSQEISLKLIKPFIEPKMQALKGVNIWKTNLGNLRNDLVSNDWIKNVSIQRKLPNQIHMKVELENIVLLYVDSNNKIHPVTQSGKVLPRVNKNLAPSAPIIRNKKILKSASLMDQVIELLDEVPNMQALKKSNIAEVDLLPVTGLTLHLINEDALVHFGLENVPTKGLQILRVTDYLKSQKQKARVIDASFSKKVLVRLRKRS